MTVWRWESEETWRSLRGRWLWVLVGLTWSAAVLAAFLEHRAAGAYALDRVLLGLGFQAVVPLSCYAVTRRVFPGSIEPSLFASAQYGVDRRFAFLGRSLVALCLQVGVVLSAALLMLLVAGTEQWGRELLLLSWVAPLAALAHGSCQLLFSTFGRHGATFALLGDWVLGSTNGGLSLPWPRGHVRSLLGGAPVLDLSQEVSSAVLWGMVVGFVGLSVFRVRR